MDDKPKLELPQRVVAKSAIFDRRSTFFAACTLMLFGVVVALLVRRPAGPSVTKNAGASWSADQRRSLAMRLEDRNLHTAAATAWERYLEVADIDSKAGAAIRYRIGKLHQSAEAYQDAIAAFYRAEAMLGDDRGDLGHELNVRIRDCFAKLGQFGDLDRDLAERTSPQADRHTRMTGQQVVAEIGAEKISVADFDRMLKQEIDLAVKAMPGISDEQVDDIRKRFARQYASRQARERKLRELVSVKVLARKAREDGLDKTPAFRKRLMEMSGMLLANRLLTDEVGKRATVTIDDCKRFYEANKARYVEPGRAGIAHIVRETDKQAGEIIKLAKDGTKFEELAKKHSLDATTKDKGGVIGQPVSELRADVPGIGKDKALHEAIFKAEAGDVLDKPHKGAGGFHVVKVLSLTKTRQLGLDEVADQVRADTGRARTREITEQYLKDLFAEAKVKLYPEAFSPTPAPTPATTAPASSEDGE